LQNQNRKKNQSRKKREVLNSKEDDKTVNIKVIQVKELLSVKCNKCLKLRKIKKKGKVLYCNL